MKSNILTLLYLSLLFLFGCNPFPKKDKHPEVPIITDLLKDKTKFRKVADLTDLSEIIVLKDDRVLLKPNNSNLEFKIIDVGNKLIFKAKYDWKIPFYIDDHGDLYINRKKYFYPEYTKMQEFKTVVFQDSIDNKFADLSHLNDSLRSKAVDEYEKKLLKTYGLVPCEYQVVNTKSCDVFEIRNDALIIRQSELFKVDFLKPKKDIPKFDDDVLIAWRNGKVPTPTYLSYYQFDGLKFKCGHMTYPKTIRIAKKDYLYSPDFGLYEIL
ncbi:hypothetical protein QFZ37_003610 [Chryseobacterium ginsenosidimutans]|uniref:hypothetical protein n=1 Tax=Chryseobacterium ginsenosidimutans TaxID=687846 RepID=UPI00278727EB|nr:hypothetical protein [Chryseobacterium ginsenosidimutans]MDQ0595241.1 hypothetical protein [Chryseobacterium ginsenosidimutans]